MIARICIGCLICAEALAIYVFAEFVANGYGKHDPHAVAAWAVVLTVAVSYALPGLLSGVFISERRARVVLTIAGVVLLYALLRIEFAHDLMIWDFGWVADFMRKPSATFNHGSHVVTGAIFLFAAWLWGAYRSNSDLEPELVPRSFAAPFVLVTVVVIIGAATDRAGEIGRGAVAFYVLDVLALVLSQLALSGTTIGGIRSGGVAATLLGGTIGVVVAGVVLVTIVFAVVAPIFGPALASALDHVLVWVLTPFAWVLEHLFSLLFGGKGFNPPAPTTVNPAKHSADHSGHSHGALIGLYALRGAGIVVALAIIAGGIALVARLRRRSRTSEQPNLHVGTAGSLGEDVGDFFRRIMHRPERARPSSADAATKLYLEVLGEAERRGATRSASTTPTEFVVPLRQALQSSLSDEITRAFEQARYGGHPPDAETLARLRDRWQHVL